MSKIGYIRVSSVDQNTARQLDGIDLDIRFEEHASAANRDRPELEKAMDFARAGDIFIVHSMDRLARDLQDLVSIVDELNDKGVAVQFIKEQLTISTDGNAISRFIMQVMGAVAEFERTLIRERQREGIEKAKERGVYVGGKPKLTAEEQAHLYDTYRDGMKIKQLQRYYGISRATVYNYINAEKALREAEATVAAAPDLDSESNDLT